MAKEQDIPQVALAVRSSDDKQQLAELAAILEGGDFNAEIVDDPALVSQQIVRELMSAESDEELEFVGTAESWGELEGIPIEILGFKWRPSGFEGTAVYFVVYGHRMDDGEHVVLTTSSLNVAAQLWNLAYRNRLPGAVRILRRAEHPTAGGFYPMRLVSTDDEIAARKAARVAARKENG